MATWQTQHYSPSVAFLSYMNTILQKCFNLQHLFSLFMYKATYVKRKITSIPGKSKQPFNLASRIYLFQGFNHMLHFLLTQNYFFCY